MTQVNEKLPQNDRGKQVLALICLLGNAEKTARIFDSVGEPQNMPASSQNRLVGVSAAATLRCATILRRSDVGLAHHISATAVVPLK